MSQFAVDPVTGELLRSDGTFVRIDGLPEVAQHVRVRLRQIRGEVPTDLTKGVQWFGLILAKGTPVEHVEQELTETALGTPGVASIDLLTLIVDPGTRVGTVQFEGSASIDDARARTPLHDTFGVPLGGTSA